MSMPRPSWVSGAFVLLLGLASGAHADESKASGAIVQNLRTELISGYAGHELDMITVEYPPGGGSKPHRHNSYVLVYVLEGAVEMKLQGAPLVIVRAGESFVEHPEDVHEVSRNASQTEPAKFLVVALKSTAQPLSMPVASR